MNNLFIECLWRSSTYECVYLHEFDTGSEPRWIDYDNAKRPHSILASYSPDEAYCASGQA